MHKQMQRKSAMDNNEQMLEKKEKEKDSNEQMQRKKAMDNNEQMLKKELEKQCMSRCRGRRRRATASRC